MSCKISWVDAQGRPTPDDNPAVGTATVRFFDDDGSIRKEQSFPICAEHLTRLPSEPSYFRGKLCSEWSFEAY